MKLSELKKQIEDAITEILGEGENEERIAKEAEKKSIDAQIKALTMKKAEINKSGVVAETEDEDEEFDTLDDTASDKESNKSAKEEEKKNKKINKKRDEIISAYKKIAGDIKAKAKAANSGDKEAKAWILKHQDTIKAYNKLKN